MVATRRHSGRLQRVRDVLVAGHIWLWWAKRRWFCDETGCARRTFSEATVQVPPYARSTTRLRQALVAAVVASGRAGSQTPRAHRVSWWLVGSALNSAAVVLPDVDELVVRRLGIDEHRYRSVRFFRDPAGGGWRRFEPWMSTFANADTGRVLGVVDGRGSATIGAWLAARSTAWREHVEVVAIDPSAPFRKAITEQLPHAAVSVDAFHLVKLANDALTAVRQRR